jgi:DNA-binding LacI/PurR family transcriptional regulator
MMNQEKKVLIVAPSFETVFHAAIYNQLKKLFIPDKFLFRSITDEESVQKERLETALEQIHPTVLVAVSVRPDNATVDAYVSAHVPIILIDEEMAGLTTISTDNFIGGRMAAEYLISNGRKKIAIVSGRTQVKGGYNAEQRMNGFMEAFTTANCSFSKDLAIEVKYYSREEGIEVMPLLLEKGIDAVFCAAGDDCAIGLLMAAKDRGKRIPDDVAIVGFDDTLVARVSNPSLTTIRQPLEKIAETTYKTAMKDTTELLQNPQKTRFQPEMVIRKSA